MPGFMGWQGFLVLALVLLLVFGPKRLPEMGRSVGGGMREFKDSIAGDDKGDEALAVLATEAGAYVEAPADVERVAR